MDIEIDLFFEQASELTCFLCGVEDDLVLVRGSR